MKITKERWERAQAWSRTTGRPLPPHLREREATSGAVPMSVADRIMHYQTARIGYNTGLLDGLTTAQHRRVRHKISHLAAVRRRRRAAS